MWQRAQKKRLPISGVRVKDDSVDSGLSTVNAEGFTKLPIAPSFVHSVQLQREPVEGSSSTSNWTSPQRQVP